VTGPLGATLRMAWSKPVGRAGLLLLGALALLAVFGPMALPDPAAQGDLLAESLRPPGESHLFGTDQLSRDVFARVASGLRLSLMLGVLAAAFAVGRALGGPRRPPVSPRETPVARPAGSDTGGVP